MGDLLAFRDITLSGAFDLPTANLAASGKKDLPEGGLGKIHGEFNLSDRDGSFGLEALSAEVEDTPLFSLKVDGLFDDIGSATNFA